MGYVIVTRYHGPTNYRGSRIIGTGPAAHLPAWDAPAGTRERLTRATVGWDYGAGNPARDDEPAAYGGVYDGWGDADANHRRAADAVAARLRADGWNVTIAADDRGVSLPDDSGRVFVLRYGADALPDPAAILTDALTGPTSGATARRLAPGTADALASAGYAIVRASR